MFKTTFVRQVLLKLGKNATETYEMIKIAFRYNYLSLSKTFDQFKRLKDGRQYTKDDPCFEDIQKQ